MEKVKRGEVYLCDLSGGIGQEMDGVCRPVIICSNDVGNKYSNICQVIPVTSSVHKKRLPTHVFLEASRCGFDRDSVALAEQSRIVDQGRLFCKVAELDNEVMMEIENALMINFGIMPPIQSKVAMAV